MESDTRLHGLLVEAGGRARLSELWHSLDGQMGALMRSSLEFQGSDLSEVVDRHKTLIDAVRGRDRAVLAEAIKEHYLSPRSFHDHDRESRDDGDHPMTAGTEAAADLRTRRRSPPPPCPTTPRPTAARSSSWTRRWPRRPPRTA